MEAETLSGIHLVGLRRSLVSLLPERPDELSVGNRNTNNQVIVMDPSRLKPRGYALYFGGRSEGSWDDNRWCSFSREVHFLELPISFDNCARIANPEVLYRIGSRVGGVCALLAASTILA